tara:strand:- start:348 stop:1202 length:855 start_codon:yes stop_codon:yes gene_type:complete
MKILTFDIEDWFHIIDSGKNQNPNDWDQFEYRINDNVERILDLLQRKNQKATFFCLGWIARKFPEIIKKIDQMDFEIGSHSNSHIPAFNQNKIEFRDDLVKSISIIEDLTNKKVKYYRAPSFSIKKENQWVFDELIRNGIEIDCSIFPSSRSNGGFEGFPSSNPSIISCNGRKIKEFPINVFKFLGRPIVFSGGGYFRLIPYFLINKMTNKSNYVISYFHPRDFDINQPIIKNLSYFQKFKSYVGLNSSFSKLEKLLNDFEFIDLKEANANIKWNNVQIVKLNI